MRNVSSECFEAGLESAYAVIPSPSPAELMAKRILNSLPPGKGAGRMPPTPRAKATTNSDSRFVITPTVRDWIRKTILAWPGPTVTWEGIRDAVRKKYPKGLWKRQSLARYPVLQDAFRATKKRLAQEKTDRKASGKPKASGDELAQRRIQFLEGRVQELETENGRLKNQFIRWQRNAFAAGITLAQLDRPLRPIDRGQVNE